MEENFSDKLTRIAKAAFLGFLGATAMIHITLIFIPIYRDFENRYLGEEHHEYETATLLTVSFLTMVMEPVIYIVNLAVFLEKYGFIAFLWLAPVAISQSYAFTRWIIRRQS
jgi:hypothetical protein